VTDTLQPLKIAPDTGTGADLRSFLRYLEEHHPDEVLEIDVAGKRFDLQDCDAAAVLTQLRNKGRKPVLLFRGVTVADGSTWPGKVLFSELSSSVAQAVAIEQDPGASFEQLAQAYTRRIGAPHDPVQVARAEAPVKQNVWVGDEASLYRLPIYRKDEFDARPGWICAIAVAHEVDSPRYNLSWHRLHVRAPHWAAARINPRHLNEYMQGYHRAGQTKMPIAFVVGHHPAFELGAAAACGWDLDEYRFTGGVMGQPVRVVASETFGDDLLVPADAEVVIEGYVDLTRRELCGPWADFMRYYSPQTLEPVFEPTAITFRDGPIFIENWTSQEVLGNIAFTAQMYAVLKQRFPGVRQVVDVAPFTIVIQVKLTRPGEGTRLAALAFGSFGDFVKNVILVDEDIDPANLQEVMFSIATRTDADSPQVQIIRDLAANRQDPSNERDMRVGGLFIDSTKPLGKPFPQLGRTPQAALDRVKLEDLLA
jgi:2,5-furandicarboxylate decarboxylase 1